MSFGGFEKMKSFLYGMLGALVIAGLVAWGPFHVTNAATKEGTSYSPSVNNPSQALQRPAVSPLNAAKEMSAAFVDVSRRVTPSIVMIVNQEKLENSLGDDAYHQLFGDDFFERFFNFSPREREQVQKTLGSGVVVSSDGYIITNNHVVEHSTKLQVTLPDGRRVAAKIIGTDPKTDLALVKVQANNLAPLAFADYNDIQVGEWVLAIGSPFGEALQKSVTAGIISAKGRSNVGIADYEDFLQTDAAINPGNSGGALVDLDGRLIGINTAILSASGANAGVGFAIPVSIVQNVMNQLKSNGRVVRGYVGVIIQDLTPDLQRSLNAGNSEGAVVSEVEKDSPAEKAGLKPYDIITSVNGKEVHSNAEVRNMISAMKPASTAELGIIRDGKQKTVRVTLTEMKGESMASGKIPAERQEKLGVEVQTLTPDIARQLGTEQKQGVVITQVAPGSVAEDAGLQKGDVIFEVNRQPVSSVREFENQISSNKSETLLLAVDRQGNSFFVTLALD
jgi:serine protease Do